MLPDHLAPTALVIFTLAVSTGGCADPKTEHAADLVFTGGAVYTVDPSRSWASAVAVSDGRIVYVGDDGGVEAHIGDETRVIDLAGRMLLPGFHDSHMHPMSGGTQLLRCQLTGLAWPDEVHEAIRKCMVDWSGGEWFRGIGLTEEAFDTPGLTREMLDELVPDRPALVSNDSGFLGWANTSALKIAGIEPHTSDSVPGTPSGMLSGTASGRVWAAIPEPGPDIYREVLKTITAEANRYGITSLNDARVSETMLEAYLAAEQAGELSVRVQASLAIERPYSLEPLGVTEGLAQVERILPKKTAAPGTRVRVDAVKFFLDGDFLNQSAAVLEPYENSANDRGRLRVEVDALNSMVELFDAAGIQVHIHAVGDRAVRVSLDAIERAIDINGPRDRRHQLAHIKLIDPIDLPRFEELGVVADYQALWARNDRDNRQESVLLGAERSARLIAIASVAASGARIVAGSDWPSESMRPMHAIQVAVTRRPVDGSELVWLPNERVGLAGILEAYTINGAWLSRSEFETGSIEVGKAADLIVLERNLFDVDPMELHKVSVQLTLLDGEPVYRDTDFTW